MPRKTSDDTELGQVAIQYIASMRPRPDAAENVALQGRAPGQLLWLQ